MLLELLAAAVFAQIGVLAGMSSDVLIQSLLSRQPHVAKRALHRLD